MRTKRKIISVKQPWAWCIIHGGKNVENRKWKTKHRGELWIHAGKQFDWEGYAWLMSEGLPVPNDMEKFVQGGIIGKVHLISIVKNFVSKWSIPNKYHWILGNPEEIIFEPMNGNVGIFDYEP
jgi:hypothetical protein